MQYTDRYTETIFLCHNINTTEGGSHIAGFKSALTRVFNDYAKRSKFIKDNESFPERMSVKELRQWFR